MKKQLGFIICRFDNSEVPTILITETRADYQESFEKGWQQLLKALPKIEKFHQSKKVNKYIVNFTDYLRSVVIINN